MAFPVDDESESPDSIVISSDLKDTDSPLVADEVAHEEDIGSDTSGNLDEIQPQFDREEAILAQESDTYSEEYDDYEEQQTDIRRTITDSIDISASHLKNTVFGANKVFIGGENEKDPTYKVKMREQALSNDYGASLDAAKRYLLQDRILLLQSPSISSAITPLQTLQHALSPEFLLRTCEKVSFDLNFFRRTNLRYKHQTITYLNLFNSPLDASALMQADYVNEIQCCLKKQNNRLILIVSKEAFEDSGSLHTASDLHRWEVKSREIKPHAETVTFDDECGAAINYACAFFPGLDVLELDELMTLISSSEDTNANVVEHKEEDKGTPHEKKVRSWERDSDEIVSSNSIVYLDREGDGVGYYFKDKERESSVRQALIQSYPQLVMRKTTKLLPRFFSSGNSSNRFFSYFLELIIFLEQRRSSVLDQEGLVKMFTDHVLAKSNDSNLARFCLIVEKFDKHPATRHVAQTFLDRQLESMGRELNEWDKYIEDALGEAGKVPNNVQNWVQQNHEVEQHYLMLVSKFVAIYTLFVDCVDWRTGGNVDRVYRLTFFKRYRSSHSRHLCQGIGLLVLYEYLMNNWQDIQNYGMLVYRHHTEVDQVDIMLDAFNMAIRQILSEYAYTGEGTAAKGLVERLQDEQYSLTKTIAQITLTRTPYKPSKQSIIIAFTPEGATMSVQKNTREKSLIEIAHFYEKLSRALVRYADETTESMTERKKLARVLIRSATWPLMSKLKKSQRLELSAELRSIQEKNKAYWSRHSGIKRGTARHYTRWLVGEAMRMLRGNLKTKAAWETSR